jgi:hypothetical protein
MRKIRLRSTCTDFVNQYMRRRQLSLSIHGQRFRERTSFSDYRKKRQELLFREIPPMSVPSADPKISAGL